MRSTGGKKQNNCWDTWKISACTVACVCVHVNRCTTGVLNIFSPVSQEAPNFRPHVSCGFSPQYKLSIYIAGNSDFTHNRVPFIWKLPYPTESMCQNEINFKSPEIYWYSKVLRCTDKHALHNWCQGKYCCMLNLFRDADSDMTFKFTTMTLLAYCV